MQMQTYFIFIENIIMWRECSGDSTIDYALSFQESSGCQQIW